MMLFKPQKSSRNGIFIYVHEIVVYSLHDDLLPKKNTFYICHPNFHQIRALEKHLKCAELGICRASNEELVTLSTCTLSMNSLQFEIHSSFATNHLGK